MENNPLNSVDVLRHVEKLVENTNKLMEEKSKGALSRYPITFTILVLFGVVALHEGVKGVLEEFGLIDHSVTLLIIGLAILIVTGTVFKKLEK